jgi:hypothetical protein
MGDRCNVIFKQEDGCYLGLYHHSAGYRVKELAATGISAVLEAGRQNHEAYANRIAVSHIVGNQWSNDLNYGLKAATTINGAMQDNQRDVVVVA